MIDVIIPVYRGEHATRRCIDSVLACAQREPFSVVVVDDASPEPAIASYLDGLARAERITLLRNESNLGFVVSVNRAMALDPDRDVVLLNSDTEVANDWLDRLHRCAYASPETGTVTPFSNNATICSYPFDGWRGGVPGQLGLAALDRLVARVNAGRSAELPTAVGFCMYIRRACLDAVGRFDQDRFGRGYGEENDFCLRAANAGWRNVLAADLFVFHEGAVSFSGERAARAQAAETALLNAHPDYLQRVHEFVMRDPLRSLRDAIDEARVRASADEAACVVAERAAHCAALATRLADAEALLEDPRAKIATLAAGLRHAEALIDERDREIVRLRAGLAHAETLAFARAEELERLQRGWLGKLVVPLMRKR